MIGSKFSAEFAAIMIMIAVLWVMAVAGWIIMRLHDRAERKRVEALRKKRADPYGHIWKEYT